MKILRLLLLFLLPGLFASCEHGSEIPREAEHPDLSSGVFFINLPYHYPLIEETQILFKSRKTTDVKQIPYELMHGAPLEKGFSAMSLVGSKIAFHGPYLPYIYLADPSDLSVTDTLSGFYHPSVIGHHEGRYYVADNYSGTCRILIFNENESAPAFIIPIKYAVNEIHFLDDFMFLTPLSPEQHEIAKISLWANSVQYGYAGSAPASMEIDGSNKLWILCNGYYENLADTTTWNKASLVKMNP